jgi:rubrerythrin
MSIGRTRLAIRSTEEPERGTYSTSLDTLQRYEVERILTEFAESDRRLARRLHKEVAWTLAFSVGAFVVALVTYWIVATSI